MIFYTFNQTLLEKVGIPFKCNCLLRRECALEYLWLFILHAHPSIGRLSAIISTVIPMKLRLILVCNIRIRPIFSNVFLLLVKCYSHSQEHHWEIWLYWSYILHQFSKRMHHSNLVHRHSIYRIIAYRFDCCGHYCCDVRDRSSKTESVSSQEDHLYLYANKCWKYEETNLICRLYCVLFVSIVFISCILALLQNATPASDKIQLYSSFFSSSSGLGRYFTTWQGLPTATQSLGISLHTTLPAPMTTRSPMVTPGQIMVFPPMKQSSPIRIGLAYSHSRRAL